jgi:coatomer subunit beta
VYHSFALLTKFDHCSYAKSIFGEDALVNISIEKQTDGKICGNIRIRSKTQGIALSLGDKITLKQKGQ